MIFPVDERAEISVREAAIRWVNNFIDKLPITIKKEQTQSGMVILTEDYIRSFQKASKEYRLEIKKTGGYSILSEIGSGKRWVSVKETIKGKDLNEFEKKHFLTTNETEQKQDANQDITCTYSTKLLQVQRRAIREILDEGRDIKKGAMTKRIKEIGAEMGVEVADRIADAMFTIIKREDHNPKRKN